MASKLVLMASFILAILSTTASLTALGADPEIKRGDTVVVTKEGARLRLKEETVATLSKGQKLKAHQVSGRWLGTYLVIEGERKGGWIHITLVALPGAPTVTATPEPVAKPKEQKAAQAAKPADEEQEPKAADAAQKGEAPSSPDKNQASSKSVPPASAAKADAAAFRKAITSGDVNATLRLLELGANANSREMGEGDMTALMVASAKGHRAVAEALLQHGAEIDSTDKVKSTALMYAAAMGHETVVRMLMERGADRELKNITGATAASVARNTGRKRIADLLEGRAESADSPPESSFLKRHGTGIGKSLPPAGIPLLESIKRDGEEVKNEKALGRTKKRRDSLPKEQFTAWFQAAETATGTHIKSSTSVEAMLLALTDDKKVIGNMHLARFNMFLTVRMSLLFPEDEFDAQVSGRLLGRLVTLQPADVKCWKQAMDKALGKSVNEVILALLLLPVDPLFVDGKYTATSAEPYLSRLSQVPTSAISDWMEKVDRHGGLEVDAAVNIILVDQFFPDGSFSPKAFSAALNKLESRSGTPDATATSVK